MFVYLPIIPNMILLHILKRIVSICKLKLKTTLEQEHKLISDQPVHGSNLREQYFFISPYHGTERERELSLPRFKKKRERFESNCWNYFC
jgi:hypothetical protein